MKLRTLTTAATCAAAAISLSACATLPGGAKVMTADDQVKIINALAAAGCKTNLNLSAGLQSASGVSVGAGSFAFAAGGSCDPANAPKPIVAPLKDAGQVLDAVKGFGGGGASGAYEP